MNILCIVCLAFVKSNKKMICSHLADDETSSCESLLQNLNAVTTIHVQNSLKNWPVLTNIVQKFIHCKKNHRHKSYHSYSKISSRGLEDKLRQYMFVFSVTNSNWLIYWFCAYNVKFTSLCVFKKNFLSTGWIYHAWWNQRPKAWLAFSSGFSSMSVMVGCTADYLGKNTPLRMPGLAWALLTQTPWLFPVDSSQQKRHNLSAKMLILKCFKNAY